MSDRAVAWSRGFTDHSWLDRVQQALARFPMSIIQLSGRVGVGVVFFKAGLLKYNSFEFAVKLFEALMPSSASSGQEDARIAAREIPRRTPRIPGHTQKRAHFRNNSRRSTG